MSSIMSSQNYSGSIFGRNCLWSQFRVSCLVCQDLLFWLLGFYKLCKIIAGFWAVKYCPSHHNPQWSQKININFCFHIFFGTSESFVKALKAFIKRFEAPQRNAKIRKLNFIVIQRFEISRAGRFKHFWVRGCYLYKGYSRNWRQRLW